MNIKYDFDFADITKTLDVVDIVKEYGICRIPNYLKTEITSKLKSEALELNPMMGMSLVRPLDSKDT